MFTFKIGEIHTGSELFPSSPLRSNSQMLSVLEPLPPQGDRKTIGQQYIARGRAEEARKSPIFPNSKCKEILLFNGRVCANLRLEVPRRKRGKIFVARRTFFLQEKWRRLAGGREISATNWSFCTTGRRWGKKKGRRRNLRGKEVEGNL